MTEGETVSRKASCCRGTNQTRLLLWVMMRLQLINRISYFQFRKWSVPARGSRLIKFSGSIRPIVARSLL